MAYYPKFATLHRLLHRHRTPIPSQFRKRWLSGNAEWVDPPDFAGMNAYDILGVSPTSSFAQIKASFRKLAKETHPDLAHSQNHSAYASKNFIQILAAYEVPFFLLKFHNAYTCQISGVSRFRCFSHLHVLCCS